MCIRDRNSHALSTSLRVLKKSQSAFTSSVGYGSVSYTHLHCTIANRCYTALERLTNMSQWYVRHSSYSSKKRLALFLSDEKSLTYTAIKCESTNPFFHLEKQVSPNHIRCISVWTGVFYPKMQQCLYENPLKDKFNPKILSIFQTKDLLPLFRKQRSGLSLSLIHI